MSYTSDNGYIRIKLQKNHPCSFKNQGWGYEHNVVVYERTGLMPDKDIHVHHINGDKTDNRPCNLAIYDTSVHLRLHNLKSNNKKPFEENYEIECACGCGQKLMRYDESNRPRDRIYGHWNNLWEHPVQDQLLKLLSCGEMRAKAINEYFGRDMYTYLNYMMKRGFVKKIKHGVYALNEKVYR